MFVEVFPTKGGVSVKLLKGDVYIGVVTVVQQNKYLDSESPAFKTRSFARIVFTRTASVFNFYIVSQMFYGGAHLGLGWLFSISIYPETGLTSRDFSFEHLASTKKYFGVQMSGMGYWEIYLDSCSIV